MSALPARTRQDDGQRAGSVAAAEWARLQATAPQVVLTMRRYLRQLATFLAPAQRRRRRGRAAPVRPLAGHRGTGSPRSPTSAVIDIEDYKVWLAAQPGQRAS